MLESKKNIVKEKLLIRKYEDHSDIVNKITQKRKVQGKIWRYIVHDFIRSANTKGIVLKADLWNEAVDEDRNFSEIYRKMRYRKIIFVEFSRKLCISYFKKKVKNRDFIINGNLSSLALKDEVLDTIIDISTSDHFNSNEFAITIKEYARVLKNHGLFILFHSNNDYYLLDIIKKSRFLRIPMYYRKDTEIERELTKYFTIRKKGFIFNLLLDPILTGTFFRIISRFLPKEFINLTIRINNKRLSPQVAYICQKIPNKNKN